MFVSQGPKNLSEVRKWTRRGSILVLTAVMLVVIFAFVAFSIDVGFISLTKTRLQNNADAAALAAAMELNGVDDPALVRANARKAAAAVVLANSGNDPGATNFDASLDVDFGKMTWDGSSYKYQWGDQHSPYNVVRVFGRRGMRDKSSALPGGKDERLPMFFAPVLGINKSSITTSAVATFQPRDIMVVLDYSGSMCYDSRLMRIDLMGRAAVENNLLKMYQDLGSPVYGDLDFAPEYAVYKDGGNGGLELTYRGTSIVVDSSAGLSSVSLEFSDGSTETVNLGSLAGVKQILDAVLGGSGKNSSKVIVAATIKPGSSAASSGGKSKKKGGKGSTTTAGIKFDFSAAGLEKALQLQGEQYPYPAGSWQEYIEYAMDSGNEVDDAGYRFKFGYMTWLNYLQAVHGSYADTPDLWKTSEQPISILKSAVDEFIDYLVDAEADDKVGLSVYSMNNATGAKLESGLTHSISTIKTISRQRQAGHYDPFTNIGAGMKVARTELLANARPKAHKLMIVMTDGVVNKPTNASVGRALVLSEAQAAADAKIKIVTISMGVLADTALMQQVADTADGIHFNVPGGADFDLYKAQMMAVFKQIAASRPLKLVSGQ